MKLKRILSVALVAVMLVCITSVYAMGSRATAPKYNVTKGANASFTGKETLTFLTDGDGVDYEGIYVDLIELEIGEDYVMGGDNGMFKIKPEFLKTLKDGKHELTIRYVDGYALTTFTTKVGNSTGNPATDTTTIGAIDAVTDTTTIGASPEVNISTVGGAYIYTTVITVVVICVVGIVIAMIVRKKNK